MAEAVYNASGLGLPIVMTLGNRAIGAPINIWNDHSDAMSMCDSGWMQLFAETNQEAADLHIQAFRLAEELSMPVMVCVDGFILTHAVERVDIPDQADGRRLPAALRAGAGARSERADLDRRHGRTGRLHRSALSAALQAATWRCVSFREFAADFKAKFGRDSGGLLRTYRADDAELIVVAMGSVNGTIKDTIDEMRDDGVPIGLVTLVSFRPFPTTALREKLVRARNVVVIEKSFAVGMGGPLANNVDLALRNVAGAPQVHSVIAGLGGRSDHARRRCTSCSGGALVQPWEGSHVPRSQRERSSPRSCTTCARCAARDRPPKICCVGSAKCPKRLGGREGERHERTHSLGRHAEAALLPEGHLHRRQSPDLRSANARCRPRSTAPTR